MEKVLAIHWRWSDIKKPSWLERKEIFKKYWMQLDLYQFDKNYDPIYEAWKETFDKIDFSKYKKIYTHSLWWVMLTRYLNDNKIEAEKIVMIAPWKSLDTEKGLKPNLSKFWDDFEKKWFNLLVNDIIVIHAKDDEVVPIKNWKNFAKKIGAKFITFEKWWHWLKEYYDFFAKLVKEKISFNL